MYFKIYFKQRYKEGIQGALIQETVGYVRILPEDGARHCQRSWIQWVPRNRQKEDMDPRDLQDGTWNNRIEWMLCIGQCKRM